VYLVNVSLLPSGHQCLIDFFCHSRLLLIGWNWKNFANCTPTAEKRLTESDFVVTCSKPINFYPGVIILHLQSVLVDKKATIPLSSQPCLVLNARNIFFQGGKPAAALI
jgi:hypothetical protein